MVVPPAVAFAPRLWSQESPDLAEERRVVDKFFEWPAELVTLLDLAAMCKSRATSGRHMSSANPVAHLRTGQGVQVVVETLDLCRAQRALDNDVLSRKVAQRSSRADKQLIRWTGLLAHSGLLQPKQQRSRAARTPLRSNWYFSSAVGGSSPC